MVWIRSTCYEELIYELIDKCFPGEDKVALNLTISYAELDDTTHIHIDCAGVPYNPFEQEEDSLNVTILKNTAKELYYHCANGLNQIIIKI